MPVELKVPSAGESITEVEIGEWKKTPGDNVRQDETVVVIESEKASLDLPAPESGTITAILKKTGETAKVGEVIALLEPGQVKVAPPSVPAAMPAAEPTAQPRVMPAAARAAAEHKLNIEEIKPTGPGGRLLKEDVLRQVEKPLPELPKPATRTVSLSDRREEVVRMTPLRRTVAKRLVEAQQTAALLTTFNEVDMSAVVAMRKQYQESFTAKHGVKLGFMSFFVKATIDALRQCPPLNAEVRGNDIVYRNYHDIGIAVGSGKGLVVPVLRGADRMSFAEIELAIADFGKRAQDNKITLDDLEGGTFTISNGGVYGSLLSTPIVNPPQSGILGLHAIQDRPVAREGQVVIRPMMYLALTYDHRIVDGREAVTFLKRIKEVIEEPARMLTEV